MKARCESFPLQHPSLINENHNRLFPLPSCQWRCPAGEPREPACPPCLQQSDSKRRPPRRSVRVARTGSSAQVRARGERQRERWTGRDLFHLSNHTQQGRKGGGGAALYFPFTRRSCPAANQARQSHTLLVHFLTATHPTPRLSRPHGAKRRRLSRKRYKLRCRERGQSGQDQRGFASGIHARRRRSVHYGPSPPLHTSQRALPCARHGDGVIWTGSTPGSTTRAAPGQPGVGAVTPRPATPRPYMTVAAISRNVARGARSKGPIHFAVDATSARHTHTHTLYPSRPLRHI